MESDPRDRFLAALEAGVVLGDGAMATTLHAAGVPVRTCYEHLSLTDPRLVRQVHEAYLAAGAMLLQTNTFGAHRSGLTRYGLEAELRAINLAAVQLAREAVHHQRSNAFVFGTIGSVCGVRPGADCPVQPAQRSALAAEFAEQMEILLTAGVDGLLLETFATLAELRLAVEVARALTPLPLIANLSPAAVGVTQDGVSLPDAFAALRTAGADVVGLNCQLGPAGILRSFEQVPLQVAQWTAAVPNAGMLKRGDGELSFTGNADYFASIAADLVAAGVRLVGGCCGTTPDHIRAAAKRLADLPADATRLPTGERIAAKAESPGPHERTGTSAQTGAMHRLTGAAATVSSFGAKRSAATDTLVSRVALRTTILVELDPPRTLDCGRFFDGAAALAAAGADFVTMADNSLGHVRISNMAMAARLKASGIEPLVHVTCRDRNLIGQQSHLMGLQMLGVQHVLLVTGDPTRFGDLPGATQVFEVSSLELTRMVKRLNSGIAFSGQPMPFAAEFVVGTSFNPNVANLDKALDRLARKVEAGADFVMTQPIFDVRLLEPIARAAETLAVPVFVGVMPLVSIRNAQFLHNEVPGIRIPEHVLQRMRQAQPEAAVAEGLDIARELLAAVMPLFNGIYVMTPFLRYSLSVQLIEYIRSVTGTATVVGSSLRR